MTYVGPYSRFFVPGFLPGGGEMSDEVVGFGHGGSRSIKLAIDNYGAKAARLAAMASCGLTVPPSVALPISACRQALSSDGDVSVSFQVDISRGVRGLQRTTRKWLGDKDEPLILAVRFSPAQAQGGLGVPVIYVGWTLEAIDLLPDDGTKERAAQTLAQTVRELSGQIFKVDDHLFEEAQENVEGAGAIVWRDLCDTFIAIAKRETNDAFPLAPSDQLLLAVQAIWQSWYKPRAQTYRQLYNIDDAGGIGVLIQVHVPWTGSQDVGTGWIAVRCEQSGENKVLGEFYPAGGGEKAVQLTSRTRSPVLMKLIKQANIWELKSARAERLDFVVTEDEAYILDGSPLPLSTAAEVTFAVEMAHAEAITRMDAVRRIDPARLIDILHARLDTTQDRIELAQGLSASPGAAAGRLVFSAGAAEALKSKGWQVVLVRPETSPEDIRGMQAASAIVTTRGGLTSHAAVIARGTGKPCIVSASGLKIDPEDKSLEVEGRTFQEGDYITVDGANGKIYDGKLNLLPAEVSGDLSTLLEWADDFRRMKVLTNVENPEDAELAVQFGAEGIGLCRTEHMLFQPDRLNAMRRIILEETAEGRTRGVEDLVPLLRSDFVSLFEIMRDRPVTIRLFDPPLHEFLPKSKPDIAALAKSLKVSAKELGFTIEELAETNPMLGNRGCRLLICNPELAKTLVQVIFEAAIE
ncbi:MAG: putative PEP-binding protein, partial [Pseudomonadota bacterium]